MIKKIVIRFLTNGDKTFDVGKNLNESSDVTCVPSSRALGKPDQLPAGEPASHAGRAWDRRPAGA